jgi:hypothetical protein
VQEGLALKHGGELLLDALEDILDGGVVSNLFSLPIYTAKVQFH